MIISLLLGMLFLMALGTPIAWSIALASALYMVLVPGVPLQGMVQRLINGIDSFPLLAVPFFILAGNLMNTGGITDRLVTFSKVLIGHVKGGLGHVVVVTNMITAGMSGSGVADAAGTGSAMGHHLPLPSLARPLPSGLSFRQAFPSSSMARSPASR
jgi:C4-dicarboxylate transporter DctM subunit